jgi:hypothetical protein
MILQKNLAAAGRDGRMQVGEGGQKAVVNRRESIVIRYERKVL